MPTYESTQIRVKPFLVGAPRNGHMVIRTLESPCYLSLSLAEWKVLQRLADLELTLDAYVKWHLAGREGLSFHESLQLLLRLQKAGFFEEVFSEGVMQRLEELEFQGTHPLWLSIHKKWDKVRSLLNIAFWNRKDVSLSERWLVFARSLTTVEAVLGMTAVVLVLDVRSHFSAMAVLQVIDVLMHNPFTLVLQLCFWFSLAGIISGAWAILLLKSDPRALVPYSLRLCSLFCLRIAVQKDHVSLLNRNQAFCHFALMLLLPWAFAFALWWAGAALHLSFFYVGSFCFAGWGLLELCPFYRSTLVMAVENLTGFRQYSFLGRIAMMAEVPLRRIRRGLNTWTQRKGSLNQALAQFLKDNPVFIDLPESKLAGLCQSFSVKSFNRGEKIIQQGEKGDSFYVLADGEAQVIKEKPDGSHDLLALLKPGDSFGEVALIEGVVRTASVRAACRSSVLELNRKDFDSLFPEGSDLRKTLTQTLRHLKLVQESQALSHLSPRQMREFLAIAKPVQFKPFEPIVAEGESAEHAYVLVSGTARVCHRGDTVVLARLVAGDLVGMTGILKAKRRSADVIAETLVTALKLERDDFLKLCMTNIFVAILISNLSENQASQNDLLKKAR